MFIKTTSAVTIIGMVTGFVSVSNTIYQTIIPKVKLGRVLSIVTVFLLSLERLFVLVVINYVPMFRILLLFGTVVHYPAYHLSKLLGKKLKVLK